MTREKAETGRLSAVSNGMPPRPDEATPLLRQLMIDVAPEKEDQLLQLLTENAVTFAVNDQADGIHFRVVEHQVGKVIEVGSKCIWRLWANVFAYSCLYEEAQSAKRHDPRIRNIALRSPRMRQAISLLEYAVRTDVAVRLGGPAVFDIRGLPSELPHPFSLEPSADEETADQFCLMAIGYILHHELAHIRSGHGICTGVDSILQEKEADLRAAEWLLSDPALDPKNRLKRELGIACALAWLAAIEVYVPPSGSSHPPSYDRLYQTMDRWLTNKNSPVWAFLAMLLLLHLQNRSFDWGKDVCHTSWKSVVDFCLDQISRLGR
jgi:hypothetical protein